MFVEGMNGKGEGLQKLSDKSVRLPLLGPRCPHLTCSPHVCPHSAVCGLGIFCWPPPSPGFLHLPPGTSWAAWHWLCARVCMRARCGVGQAAEALPEDGHLGLAPSPSLLRCRFLTHTSPSTMATICGSI